MNNGAEDSAEDANISYADKRMREMLDVVPTIRIREYIRNRESNEALLLIKHVAHVNNSEYYYRQSYLCQNRDEHIDKNVI